MHYYQRWNENDKSRVKVLTLLRRPDFKANIFIGYCAGFVASSAD